MTTWAEQITAGEDVSLPITVKDEAGDAIDITGTTPRFAIARRPGGTVVAETGESPETITAELTTPAAGLLTVTIPTEVTAGLLGTYYCETELEDGSGNFTTVARGYLTVRPQIV
jgi:hypothetical protein